MAEFVGKVGSGLLDLSATSLADLPHLDEETLEVAVGRIIHPCNGADNAPAASGKALMWQNYSAAN